ncbi:MAG: CAP domain-containing protein [Thermomicrobiales bacterium]
MDPDIMVSPVISDSPASPTRRSLLALLGLGPVAGGLATLLALETTEAKKKRKKRKNKKKGGKGGGKGSCTGSVNGSASASEEVTLLQLINDFRQQNGGLPPFVRQDLLDSAAVAHSRDMVTRCFFDHINPDGKDPGDRIAATGYQAAAWAENIYKGSGNLGSAAEAFDAWKNSQGHRDNMLSTAVTQIGIGTALGSAGFMNWTNVFGRPDM